MIAALLAWIYQLLLLVDRAAMLLVRFMTFVVAGVGRAPDAGETISGCVGRNALRGARWALVAEKAIDRLFVLLGAPDGHCRRVAGIEDAIIGLIKVLLGRA